jgi:hypothetical protein
MEASKQEWNDVMSISAQECRAVLLVFYVHLYFELFFRSAATSQNTSNTKSNGISERIYYFLTEKHKSFEIFW